MLRRKSNPGALRDRMRQGRVLGTFVKLHGEEAIDILVGAGFDFVIVDLEHSQLSEEAALSQIRHASALDFPAVVRVPRCDPGPVNRLLEAGAVGIQLSSVMRTRQVEELVAATRYPPRGRRSVSLAQPAARYGMVSMRELVDGEPPLLVGQIETAQTDDPLDEILGDLDVVFVGTTDLLVDVSFDRDAQAARLEEIRKAADASGIALGAFASTADEVPESAVYIALSSDLAMLQTAARAATVRASASDRGSGG